MKLKNRMMGLMALVSIGVSGAWADEMDEKILMKSCMANVKNECQKWAAQGGGSGNPRGLTNELAVEMAMGEKYMVFGTVVVVRNQALLEIDFKEHPWLKTRRRTQNPYYRIDTQDLESWRKLNRKYVSFAVMASGAIFVDEAGRKSFDIVLEPTSAPVVDTVRSLNTSR